MPEGLETRVLSSKTSADRDAIAPAWHTAIVLLVLVGMAAASVRMARGDIDGLIRGRMHAYVFTMAAEWLVVAFIALGARWRGASLRTLMGEHAAGWRSMVRDLGLALAFLIAANVMLAGVLGYVLSRLMHPGTSEAMKMLLPHSRREVAVFLLLALTAGICEEMIFRGYLQRQVTGWTKSVAVGISVQGILFGLAHAYQGQTHVIVIALYGCMFGALAHWRRSLRPGMIAHFLQDGVGGLLSTFLLK